MTNEERVLANNHEATKMIDSMMDASISSVQQSNVILAVINNNLTQISLTLAIIADILSKTSYSSNDAKEDSDERKN